MFWHLVVLISYGNPILLLVLSFWRFFLFLEQAFEALIASNVMQILNIVVHEHDSKNQFIFFKIVQFGFFFVNLVFL